jgi:hypothetical protein
VIESIAYDAASARLVVTFNGGRIYAYDGVPSEVHAAFEPAQSKGQFFNTEIKDKYPTWRFVTPRRRSGK